MVILISLATILMISMLLFHQVFYALNCRTQLTIVMLQHC